MPMHRLKKRPRKVDQNDVCLFGGFVGSGNDQTSSVITSSIVIFDKEKGKVQGKVLTQSGSIGIIKEISESGIQEISLCN